MKNIIKLPILRLMFLTICSVTILIGCEPEQYKETTDETPNITEYLRNTPEYSSFLEILDKTGYSTFMNTYGTYTLFLPTNTAIDNYLTDNGYASLDQVPLTDLQELAKLHVLEEKITTPEFTDGKIASPTLQGQYLITGAVNDSEGSSIVVNKNAKIVISNFEVGNGIIHVIDKVLIVAVKTLAEAIDSDPNLSILAEAIHATNWYDELNQPLVRNEIIVDDEVEVTYTGHLTVLAQTNDVFAKDGINSYADLKNKYSHLNDPTNPTDSLNLFVAYRIVPGLNYMADLAVSQAVLTKAPLEVIGVKLALDTILLNEETFNGVLEKGVAIKRSLSDVTTSNGVIHNVEENFFIKKRLPAPVYFDLGDQPEFRKLSAVFRKPGNSASLSDAELADITWEGSPSVSYSAPGIGDKNAAGWHGDLLDVLRLRTGYINNLELTTPVIIKGQYKVWVSYRTNGRAPSSVRMYYNDIPLARTLNMTEYGNTSEAERVLESQGYKRHISPHRSEFNCRLLGIITVETTGRHKIRFEALTGSGGNSWFDVVEFRPIDMDQLYPKFESGGDGLIYQ
ncbi:fasciclin domain-containing protein [Wenyingzhuangia sp. IMCC45467]